MSSVRKIWSYSPLVFISTLLLIALAVWQPYQIDTHQTSMAVTSEYAKNTSVAKSFDFSQEVPSDFPVPAKKLYKVVVEEHGSLLRDKALRASVVSVDNQIVKINTVLREKGMVTLESRPKKPADSSEISEKIKAIRSYMASRSSESTSQN